MRRLAGDSGAVGRRAVLGWAAGAVLLAACGRERVREAEPRRVDVAGARDGDPLYVAEAKAYLVLVPPPARAAFTEVAPVAPLEGLVAFSERCPCEGCKVEFCGSSGWFSCPCCESQWTALGDRREALRRGGSTCTRSTSTAARWSSGPGA